MPIYNYKATTRDGITTKGKREADSREDVAQFLHSQGLVIISINEKLGVDFSQLASIQIGGVPLKEKVVFVKQMSTMMSAGMPIIQALDILVQQTKNISLQNKLKEIYKMVEGGTSLSEAFGAQDTIFNPLQVNLLVAGEKGGNLNEIMLQIAQDMEKSKKLRSKIIGAMIYPVVIFVVMIAVVALMLVFMIPSVENLYTELQGDATLPEPTATLVRASNFITSPIGAFIVVGGAISIILILRYILTTAKGKELFDQLTLKIPVFGDLIQNIQLTQFNRLVAMLLTSGVPIVDALNVIADSLGNTQFRNAVKRAAIEVTKGNSLSVPLAQSGVFSPVMIKMLATGEETGKLDQITSDMAAFYEEEVDDLTSNLTKLMEPFILILVGGLVAFMAISIYLPLYNINSVVVS